MLSLPNYHCHSIPQSDCQSKYCFRAAKTTFEMNVFSTLSLSCANNQLIERDAIWCKSFLHHVAVEHEMSCRVVCSLPFYALCLFGCFFQAFQLTSDYFRFATKTKVDVNFPRLVTAPYFSFCSRFSELVDFEKARLLYNITIREEVRDTLVANFTLKQLFVLTPHRSQVLNKCILRLPKTYERQYLNGSACYVVLNTRKYYMQEFMCYMLGLNTSKQYEFEPVAQMDHAKGNLYNLRFNRSLLGRSLYITHIVHGPSKPRESRYFTNVLRLQFENNATYSYMNEFSYAFSQFHYKFLPYPYDTMCGLNNGQTERRCKQKCGTKDTVRTLGKIPFNWIIDEDTEDVDLNHKLLSSYDLNHVTIAKQFDKIMDSCAEKCRWRQCEYDTYNTERLEVNTMTEQESIKVGVFVPMFPSIYVTYEPVIETNDYILLLMSCLGTWLGVAVVDFNPVKICCREPTESSSADFRELRNTLHKMQTGNKVLLDKYKQLNVMLNEVNVKHNLLRSDVLQLMQSRALLEKQIRYWLKLKSN